MEETSLGWALGDVAWWVSIWVILAYFWLTQEMFIILSAMLFIDWLFWIVDAYINETLQSKIMVNWLIKKLARWCVPFIAVAVMRGAGFENINFISTSIVSILIIAEGYSVIWHIYSINYKKNLPEIDAFKMLIEWIADLFKKKIEDKTDLSEK